MGGTQELQATLKERNNKMLHNNNYLQLMDKINLYLYMQYYPTN